jgi:hypothetical protein
MCLSKAAAVLMAALAAGNALISLGCTGGPSETSRAGGARAGTAGSGGSAGNSGSAHDAAGGGAAGTGTLAGGGFGGVAGGGSGGESASSAGSGALSGAAGAAGTAGSAGAANAANEVDVYLLAGQSNATGQGYIKNLPQSFVVDTDVELFHSADIVSGAAPLTWIPLRHASEPPDAAGERFGPELGFGNAIQSFYTDRRIAIIKHAKSATNLVQQWAPGANAEDTTSFGPELKTFVDTVDLGLQSLRDRGLTPILRGMLWQQGEADADLGGSAAADYGKNLAAFIGRVRQQWTAPGMLFVYGYVYPASNEGPGRDQVREGEAKVDQSSGDALAVEGAFVIPTDGLSLRADDADTPYPNDRIHFGTQGQLELGRRMAEAIHEHLLLP